MLGSEDHGWLLELWRYELRNDLASQREQFVKTGVDQVRSWVKAGGTVLCGTAVGYMADYDTTGEYELMAQAGMDGRQILASLTTAPAERFGDSKRLGRIASGFVANLVVLNKDPVEDVGAFAAVRYTIRDGRLNLQRQDHATSNSQSFPSPGRRCGELVP